MELLVTKHIITETLDKDGLELTNHKILLKGSYDDVKVQITAESTDIGQMKNVFPIDRGMSFELELDN